MASPQTFLLSSSALMSDFCSRLSLYASTFVFLAGLFRGEPFSSASTEIHHITLLRQRYTITLLCHHQPHLLWGITPSPNTPQGESLGRNTFVPQVSHFQPHPSSGPPSADRPSTAHTGCHWSSMAAPALTTDTRYQMPAPAPWSRHVTLTHLSGISFSSSPCWVSLAPALLPPCSCSPSPSP